MSRLIISEEIIRLKRFPVSTSDLLGSTWNWLILHSGQLCAEEHFQLETLNESESEILALGFDCKEVNLHSIFPDLQGFAEGMESPLKEVVYWDSSGEPLAWTG